MKRRNNSVGCRVVSRHYYSTRFYFQLKDIFNRYLNLNGISPVVKIRLKCNSVKLSRSDFNCIHELVEIFPLVG